MRGRLYWAAIDLSRPTRPVCIVQAESINRTAPSLIAVPVTPTAPRAGWPLTIEVPAGAAGLTVTSWLQVTKPLTIARDRLREEIGELPTDLLAKLNSALTVVLGLR